MKLLPILYLFSIFPLLAQEKKKTTDTHSFSKLISIGENGCRIKTTTKVFHTMTTSNYLIPYPKGIKLERFSCDQCRIDSFRAEFNAVKLYGKRVEFDVVNDCKYNFKISSDSIYTISNIAHLDYSIFEEVKEIKGYGGTPPLTHFYMSFKIPKSFKFVSLKDNLPHTDFKFKSLINKNEVEIESNLPVKDFTFEIKYVKQNPNLKTVIDSLDIYGDVILKIYDASREDGDIINVFIDHKIVLEQFKARNKPVKIPIEANATSTIRIENVDEGKFPPNTVVVEILEKNGRKKLQKINVRTKKDQDYQLLLIPKN
ncbi:hypothetical protein [Aureispira anguillae]|uniref:DUF1573 domain-containing protein n=1 Tax=Aureispira anguillae TaxID=2864201 RepID=A0A915YCC0_9BACT|nr:hypothetical protein [Aureispira anguillae]BDS10444.1 hypothetical protein AsAng_0011520 [Aureispira anguillae]